MHTYDTLDKMPQRCGAAMAAKPANGRAPQRAEFDSVLLIGSGDAALAAMLFRAVTRACATVPIIATDEPDLPGFAGPDTLVIALSETGSDPLTVSAIAWAADIGAEIAIVSPPGHLTDMADSQGYVCRSIPHPLVTGAPMLGELFFGLWGLVSRSPLSSMLLHSDADSDAAAAIDLLTRQRRLFGPEATAASNPARLLADAFRDRQALIYGTSTLAGAAAAIWAERLRRTGIPAYAGHLLDDATAEGWPVTTPIRVPPSEALVLVDPETATAAAVDVGRLRSALGKAVTCNELTIDGRSPLARLWGAVYLAEWTSFYLAP